MNIDAAIEEVYEAKEKEIKINDSMHFLAGKSIENGIKFFLSKDLDQTKRKVMMQMMTQHQRICMRMFSYPRNS